MSQPPTPRRPTRGLPQADHGFALLIVLWTLVLLALLGGAIAGSGRDEARIAANLSNSAIIQAAADGGVAVAAFHTTATDTAHWPPDGRVHRLSIGSVQLRLTLTDLAGQIDPDQSPPSLIAALLRVQGIDDVTANNVANAMTDWRSPSDTGLASLYTAQHRRFGPPHETFQSVDEIGLVAYVTPGIAKLLAPHLTVFTQATPDPAKADPIVTAAIADAAKRNNLVLNPVGTDDPSLIEITAAATGPSGSFTRRAILRFGSVTDKPYEVFTWE